MRRRRLLAVVSPLSVVIMLVIAGTPAGSPPAAARAAAALNRYSIVHRCLSVASSPASGVTIPRGPFRIQATALGQYLLYGPAANFLADGSGGAPTLATAPSGATVWTVRGDSTRGFTITNLASGRTHGVGLAPATGCAAYPEGGVDTAGAPFRGASPEAQVTGTIDAHTHVTAFEFLGGDFHCGRPWDAYGIPYALPNCAPYEQGTNGEAEAFLDYGSPANGRNMQGWPTFQNWPSPTDLAEEGDYYTGIKRAWMAGLRVMVTHLVDNEALCNLMTTRRNPCDDMAAVHIQAKDLRRLQDYVDAQSGGPGKGFFRIVTNPFQARAVINSGKLAVVEGIEVSDLFHCGETLGVPHCGTGQIDAGLKEIRGLGVSTFFPVHKFDNAFGGAKMDTGETGLLVNGGNHLETGQFFNVRTCTGPEHDNTQMSSVPTGALSELLNGPGQILIPQGTLPVYPAPPHCNTRGLSSLGAYVLDKMIQQHFIVELDHMDVKTADAALSILEAHHYSGVVSAHSWDSPQENPRIYNLGGFVTPIAGASPQSFLDQWKASLAIRNTRFYNGTGFGYGADMNGLAEQSQPTSGHPIAYPFTSYDGRVTFSREQWGQRVFDLNKDGVANYGMYPDWLQELRVLAGPPVLTDMFHGAEAYLEMWERTYGVPTTRCRAGSGRFTGRGVGPIRVGEATQPLLYAAGQPSARPGRSYRYCVSGRRGGIAATFSRRGRVAMIVSTARGYSAGSIGVGSRVGRLRRSARALQRGPGIWTSRRPQRGGTRFVYRVRGGLVTAVGLADRADARRFSALRSDLASAGVA
jgi:hypothetical protein